MRWAVLLAFSTALGAAEIGGANVRTVYLLPMPHGLDHHVANQLIRTHVFDVVADPKRADAIFTDHLGVSFEAELEKLYPAPKPAPAEPQDDAAGKSEKGDSPKEKPSSEPVPSTAPKEAGSKPPTTSFGRGKGTLFLVDAKSRAVLWSVYERPKSSTPDELDRTAKRVIERLKRDLAGK